MNGKRKNVVFLTVDSLSYSSLGSSGNSPTPSPFIDKLATNGLNLTNLYSTGSATQFSFPSIMTSTYPLDHGGYDNGIIDRETALAEIFKHEGYSTGAFITASWLDRHFGYDRGYQDFYSMTDLSHYLSSFNSAYLDYYKSSKILKKDEDRAVQEIQDTLSRLFPRIITYCSEKISEKSQNELTSSPTIHGWKFNKIKSIISDEYQVYKQDKKSYVRKILFSKERNIFEHINEQYGPNVNTKDIPNLMNTRSTYTYLRQNMSNFFNFSDLHYGIAHLVYTVWNKLSFDQQKFVPSAAYLLDNSIRWISNLNTHPFFLWVHLSDIHEENFTSWEYSDGRNKKEIEIAEDHLKKIQDEDDYWGNLYHDYSLYYVDRQIKKFTEKLREIGILDDTVIVLMSDHGDSTVDRPFRPYPKITDFYEERYKIPGIIYNIDNDGEITGQYSSLDIPPTLLYHLNIKVPESFKGRPVRGNDQSSREYLIMENAGQGPCDIGSKAINVGLKKGDEKVIYENENIIGRYNLKKDPNEKNNLVNNNLDNDFYNDIITSRLDEIHNSKNF